MKSPLIHLATTAGLLLGTFVAGPGSRTLHAVEAINSHWEQCGWGGGGYYFSAAFHPAKDGTIYMGGDVAGVYKTIDHGLHWRLINNGIADYAIYSLAVDQKSPETLYAATEGGLCKSTDGGEHWTLLPNTKAKQLRITGERNRSIRSVAVDPTDSNIVYAASPGGKVYKSSDGGQNWVAVYENRSDAEPAGTFRVQFGKVSDAYFGGFWFPVTFPDTAKAADCSGIGFSFKGEGSSPNTCFVTLTTAAGVQYRSKSLSDQFKNSVWHEVVLGGSDFVIDPEYAKKHADSLATLAPTPDWSAIKRIDFGCSGSLPTEASIAKFGKFTWLTKPESSVLRDFAVNKTINGYGNLRAGDPPAATILSVAVAPKQPSLIIAATEDRGLVLSRDSGKTWTALKTPPHATHAAFDPANPDIIYGAFSTDGIAKSTDGGVTWTNSSEGLAKKFAVREIAVSPANSQDVYAIGSIGWGGGIYVSHDGGANWKSSSSISTDPHDPTLPGEPRVGQGISATTNLAINPLNPKELFVSANWRSCLSQDGGATWNERDHGADISVITDVRFSKGRAYASAMDEGSFVTEDGGVQWKQMWPLKYTPDLSGHNWRLAVTHQDGVDHIVGTVTPWNAALPVKLVTSDDGGKSMKVTQAGLPDYVIRPNTMWGQGHPRALAVDPNDPNVLYLGIDGDAAAGKSGGGIFKSTDGGKTWLQLPNQPGSRRMYYGLQVDPTDSKRIYWACCGTNGGLWRSEDGGGSWKNVFANETWLFNVHVATDGTIYAPGHDLWRSSDHGATWKRLTKMSGDGTIVGLESDPENPKRLWYSVNTWDGSARGSILKSTDAGDTWQEITGDIGYLKPQILRYNPESRELWAAGVGLFKLKQ